MLKQKQTQTITFNSGILVALGESKGTITHNASGPLPFGSRTVGFNRFYTAATAGVEIDAVIVVPLNLGLATASDVDQWIWDTFNLTTGIIYPPGTQITGLGGAKLLEARFFNTGVTKIYKIVQIQVKEDAAPPCLMVTLKEAGVLYADKRPTDKRLSSL